MSTEFRGIKEGDFVEATLVRRRQTFESKPWKEETWDEFTHYGKVYMAYRQVTCHECDGRTYLPNSNGAFDYQKEFKFCKTCNKKGTVDDPAKMGELCLKTTRGNVPWNPPLAQFRDIKKIVEDKRGQDGSRKSYEIKDGKQVPVGTAKADWIATQKKVEHKTGSRQNSGDWRMWEGR